LGLELVLPLDPLKIRYGNAIEEEINEENDADF